MHRSILAIAACTALIISGPAYAQRGHGGGKPTTTPSGSHGPSTTQVKGGATTHGNSGATTHGNSGATPHGQSGSHVKPTSSTATHGKSGETHGAGTKHADVAGVTTTKKSSTANATTTETSANATSTSTSNSTNTGSTTTLTPVQLKLQKNTNLADKLRSRLPEGTNLMKAADGFRNLGQFVAAVNVSNNLGLKFTDLKTRMVTEGMSLGQAIQDVKAISNVQTEVRRAETEANAMISSSSNTTTSTTATPNTTAPTTTTTSNATTTTSTSSTSTKKPAKTKTKSPSTEDR